MEKEALMEEFIDRLLELYRISVNEEEAVQKRYQEFIETEHDFYEKLSGEYPKLGEMLDEIMEKKAYLDIEEQKYIYRQGAKDAISLLKKLGIM